MEYHTIYFYITEDGINTKELRIAYTGDESDFLLFSEGSYNNVIIHKKTLSNPIDIRKINLYIRHYDSMEVEVLGVFNTICIFKRDSAIKEFLEEGETLSINY